MAYVTGSAANISDLAAALRNACIANGWANPAGNILSKGTSFFSVAASGNFVELKGGLGQSSGTLTTASPNFVRLGGSYMTFPVTYEIHILTNPDEVYMVVNYNSDYYQQLSFGTSDVAGAGNGPWITGAHNSALTSNNNGCNVSTTFNDIYCYCYSSFSTNAVGLFIRGVWNDEVGSSYFYTTLGTPGWYGAGDSTNGIKNGSAGLVAGLLGSLPSAFNSTTVLLPIKGVKNMTNNGVATVVNPRNARLCRLDNLTPGSIVTYGADQWKIYPWLRKDATTRNGVNNSTLTPPNHTGTYGFAIRYTGT